MKRIWLLALLLRLPTPLSAETESFEARESTRMYQCSRAETQIVEATHKANVDVDDICRGEPVGLDAQCQLIADNCGY